MKHPGELTDAEWEAWSVRDIHVKPRTCLWMMGATGFVTLLCAVSCLGQMYWGLRGSSGWWFFFILNSVLAGVNGASFFRYRQRYVHARIRERCPIPVELQFAFLSLRVQHYLDTQRARKTAWRNVKQSVMRR